MTITRHFPNLARTALMAALLAGAALPVYAARADIEAGPAAATGAVSGNGLMEDAAQPESGEGSARTGIESVEPYKLIRSLQFVQDAVVKGDHSAMEMQRYLLEVIDERLRAADQRVFDDPRNVDAALIYAMSGGNPETLDLLALQDKFGNFDNEVTTVLRAYLDGRAAQTKTTLEEIVGIYRDSVIGPYLALVAANVTAGMNDGSSLELFDWARLTAPGTLVEEAALRRSLFIATREGLVNEALDYANRYARRFINSPYAGQFADLLVDLVEDHYEDFGEEKLEQVLAFMDRPRQREVYLRISRRAAINGKKELALLAAGKAEALAGAADLAPATLANLYSSLVDVSSDNVVEASRALAAVPEANLSARDAALRDAARLIAAQVMRQPDPNSLTQAFSPRVSAGSQADASFATGSDPLLAPDPEPVESRSVTPAGATVEAATSAEAEDQFRLYVEQHGEILHQVDGLLTGRDGAEGS